MQILKIVLVASAASVCVFSGSLGARDTDAQIKAREALEQKLHESQSAQPTVTNPAPAVAPSPKTKVTPAVPPAPVPGTAGGRPVPPGSTTIPPVAPAQAAPAPTTPAPVIPPPRIVPVAQPAPTPVLPMPPASDPSAIEKAREALRQKLNQSPSVETVPVPAPQPPPSPAPAVAAQPSPKPPAPSAEPAPSPKPVAQPTPAPAVAPVPPAPSAAAAVAAAPAVPAAPSSETAELIVPPPGDSPEIIKAREALHQRMNQMPPEKPTASMRPPAPVMAKTKPTPTATPVAKNTKEAPKPVFHPAPGTEQPIIASTVHSGSKDPASSAQPQPMAKQTSRTKAEDAAKVQAQKKPKETKPSKEVKAITPRGTPAFTPIQAPPLPISADKQRRLADLLARYQADQLTPAQYHQQRAKILAEP